MIARIAAVDNPEQPVLWESRRLWSLWDMINFQMAGFWPALQDFSEVLNVARHCYRDTPDDIVPYGNHARATEVFNRFVVECVAKLRLEAVSPACMKLEDMFRRRNGSDIQYTWRDLTSLLDRLWEDTERELQMENFFHYPREAVKRICSLDRDWKSVFDKFPSSKKEVSAGIDCLALGDNVGCVFHMMRAAELGMRALANEREIPGVTKAKPVEYATWGHVIGEIEKIYRTFHAKPNGPKKEAALAFYEGAASDLRALRGNYRDKTMHMRGGYDPGQTESAIFRTKSLLETLAPKLGEGSTKPIKWGF